MSLTLLFFTLVKCIAIPVALCNCVPLLVWVERRGSAFIQDRWGPNRADIFGFRAAGLFHIIADAVKFFTKESFIPGNATMPYFVVAPGVCVVVSLMAFAVIPLADNVMIHGVSIPMSIAQVEGGILWTFAVSSLSVVGIIMAGWSSGSKYPLLGAMRTSSQMLSYEITLGLSILGLLLIYGTLDPTEMVRFQGEGRAFWILPRWGFFMQPLGFFLFLVAGFAECNRTPFDLPEGDSELVAGYHLEYSGMRFSMFYMAEYIAMITMSSLYVTLFWGGWQFPYLNTATLAGIFGGTLPGRLIVVAIQVATFVVKTGFFLWLYIWVRWTVPRFRYDQLMDLGWKVMLPLCLLNLAVTAAVLGFRG